MKKLLLMAAFVATASSSFAQLGQGEKSVIFEGQFKANPARFGLGVQGRYNILDNVRVAPEVLFIFPKDHTIGLDVNINAHYVFPIDSKLTLFPLAGISMQNYRFSYEGVSNSASKFGLNLGGGAGYALNNKSFLNLEMKYTFSDADCFNISFGYGVKF